jgi:hypothetical protein
VSSRKTRIIEKLFLERYDARAGTLSDTDVTLQQAKAAIRRWGGGLSDGNVANFMKDIVRSTNREALIPQSVVQAGWTVKQAPGGGGCFRFVPLPAGQTTAFVTSFPDSELVESPQPVQTLSLPPTSRKFGRPHETWLTHVVTNLGVVHTHLALRSSLDFIGLELLQSNVELGDAEVDAIYLGTLSGGTEVLVSCEMKGMTDVLDEDQIERGATRVRDTSDISIVVPMGVKTLRGGLVWVVEFDGAFPPLIKASEAVYRLSPRVPGIG